MNTEFLAVEAAQKRSRETNNTVFVVKRDGIYSIWDADKLTREISEDVLLCVMVSIINAVRSFGYPPSV